MKLRRSAVLGAALLGCVCYASANAGFAPQEMESPANAVGTKLGLTVLIEFPDELAILPQSEFDRFCNEPGYDGFSNTGSVQDYFFAQSGGELNYFSDVTAVIMAPKTKAYYESIKTTKASKELLNSVLDVLEEQGYDFSQLSVNGVGNIETINMLCAQPIRSGGSMGLVGHKGGLGSPRQMAPGVAAKTYQLTGGSNGQTFYRGVFCHELGHQLLGYKDLYDLDLQSNGMGIFSLMAASGSVDPTSVSAPLRRQSGWGDLVELDASSNIRCATREDEGMIYRYENPNEPQEFFLIESLEKAWNDPGGLLITHCDYTVSKQEHQNMTEALHYRISVEQADGKYDLEKNVNSGNGDDLFRNISGVAFSDSTQPDAKWWNGSRSQLVIHDVSPVGKVMTFVIGSGDPSGPARIGVDRTDLKARGVKGSRAASDEVAVWNLKGGTLSYSIEPQDSWIACSVSSGTATTEADLVKIEYKTANKAPGTYNGRIKFVNKSDASDVRMLDIELVVEEAPELAVTGGEVMLDVLSDVKKASQIMLVDNIGGGTITYEITDYPSWINIENTIGQVTGERDVHLLEFDLAQLGPGQHKGTIKIASTDGSNQQLNVPVIANLVGALYESPKFGSYDQSDDVEITWISNSDYARVDIELWQNGSFVETIVNGTANDESYIWSVPDHLDTASDYSIRIYKAGGNLYSESKDIEIWKDIASFENGFEGWVNATDDDFDWTIKTGAVSSTYTGPNKAADGDSYAYAYIGYQEAGKPAHLTRTLDLSDVKSASLEFSYHMFGSKMGSLHFDIGTSQGWTKDVWSVDGQQNETQGSAWNVAKIDLTPWAGERSVTIRFRCIGGTQYNSDFALDFIKIGSVEDSGGGGGQNRAPAFTSNPVVKANAQEGVAYQASIASNARDADGDSLTFRSTVGPAWLNVAANGALSGTPDAADVGANRWTVVVDDGQGGSATANLDIEVDAKPVVDPLVAKAGADQTVTAGNNGLATVTLNASASTGDITLYRWKENGTRLVDGETVQVDFAVGTHTVVLLVRDSSGAEQTDTVIIKVEAASVELKSNAGANQTIEAAENGLATVTLDGSASTGDISLYRWKEGGVTLIDGENVQVDLAVGTHTLVLMVKDSSGAKQTDTVVITVTPYSGGGGGDNTAPVFKSSTALSTKAKVGKSFSKDISRKAKDADGDTLTFSKVDGAAWLKVAANGKLSGTPSSSDRGNNKFTIKVSDGNGGSDIALVKIKVK